ncbi:remorin 1.4-like isoform X2 [Glycine soja]|uniref:remorin 1.4-like isoform X2 n=1 Tax=Glycine soja TaxID=3848 RepID=UPI001039A3F4|nr:remorin 1.4-like isoform X2 [Glycine soja]
MGEEVSNKTEPEDSVPKEHNSSVQETELEKPEPPNDKVTPPSPAAAQDHASKKDTEESLDKDAMLARVVTEKRLALVKAWEESEKTKAENRAYKRLSAVGFWEDSKKASVEAQLKKIEENLEKKKAEYVEKMKNKVAKIHLLAEEKRAVVEAQKREEFIDLEETASKFRSRGDTPRRFFACFSG